MPRFLPAAIAIATLALPGARAAADDCMCLGPDTLFLEATEAEGFAVEELLESPDDTIETLDPSAPAAEVAAAPEPARVPVAWCRSADDPRCQRDDNGEAPYRITLATTPVATLPTTPGVPSPGVGRIRFPQLVTHGSSGDVSRLERPPRA